ncbi:MAG: ABC transporter substrate-binding protein [Chloroflexi bacterium]|nr:ABC transporter substrate-binding protein [Chloroflexota bacterium]
MNGASGSAPEQELHSRRALLRYIGGIALGAMTTSVLAACGPAAAPATSGATPAAAPTIAPTAVVASPTTAPRPASASATTAPANPTPAAAPAGAPSGTLRYANADFSNESMDPINLESPWGFALYDSLLTFDQQGNVVGNLAENYSLSDDGLTWTFQIRKGVKFHNGDPLTAADVVFSLQRFGSKDSTNPWSPYLLKNNQSITAPDDYTVIYTAQRPEWPLKVPFAWVRIWPNKYFNQVGQDGFQANPVGTGPYKFSKWVPKTSMEFDANTDYWGPKPQWAHIIETFVPEEATRVAQLERGDVDIIGALSFDRLVELKNNGFRLQEVGLPTLASLCFPATWMTQGPTSDIRVRQAMSYAVNRQEISDTFYKGLGKPGGWWFWSEQTWGFDPSQWTADAYDPDKAKQLLSDAGYPGKFNPQTITLYTNQVMADLMQVLQGYWQNVGLQTDIQVVDSAVWLSLSFVRVKSDTDKQVGAVMPSAQTSFFNNVYHSANLFTSTGTRSTGNDPQADQMYQAAVTELDPTRAKQLWQQMMHYGYDKMWVNVELTEVPTYFVLGPNVGAFTYKQYLSMQDAYVGIQHA